MCKNLLDEGGGNTVILLFDNLLEMFNEQESNLLFSTWKERVHYFLCPPTACFLQFGENNYMIIIEYLPRKIVNQNEY